MGTFGTFKTSDNQRDNLDRQQTVFPCSLRPTILVWSGIESTGGIRLQVSNAQTLVKFRKVQMRELTR